MGKTPSGLVQGAARRATTSAWSPHPAFPQAPHSIRGSESKWAGLRHSCLGHREEGKIFSPDQLETTEEGSSSPLAGPRAAEAQASGLLERKGGGGSLCCQVSSCPRGPCSWPLACFPEA